MLATLFSWPNSTALSFGGSKLFQVLMPLLTYMALQELQSVRQFLICLLCKIRPQLSTAGAENLLNLWIGFMSWKVGCDFGFLIIATGAAPWSIAFTVAGLIPYTAFQYVLYYLIGQRMIIQGQLNPFQEKAFAVRSLRARPPLWKRFVSKFFHESMNATSAHVPLRQVFIKPFLDYGCILLTWPLYNVGLIFSQSGELNFAPIVHFTFLSIFTFYVVNVIGYILGYNLGEFLYFQGIFLWEWVQKNLRQRRRETQGYQPLENLDIHGLQSWAISITILQPIREFLGRYGLTIRWLISTGCGVMAVIMVEPSLAGFIFANADNIQKFLFHHFGHLDPFHVQQFLSASQSGTLPSVDALNSYFTSI